MGYSSAAYAHSLAEFGTPLYLAQSKGWALTRPIGASGFWDAMGCYPRFCCQNWLGLGADLAMLSADLVSLVLATDPFAPIEPDALESVFPDYMVKYKTHYVIATSERSTAHVNAHHRYYSRRALKALVVDVHPTPIELFEDWIRLYGDVIGKYSLAGIKAFSPEVFIKQLSIPGLVAITARAEKQIVGMHLWLTEGEFAYSHLAAVDSTGYRLGASYALYWQAIELLSQTARLLDLGGVSGLENSGDNGLKLFKSGWANETRISYLCGRILDRGRYHELAAGIETDYFPAYRKGELL